MEQFVLAEQESRGLRQVATRLNCQSRFCRLAVLKETMLSLDPRLEFSSVYLAPHSALAGQVKARLNEGEVSCVSTL